MYINTNCDSECAYCDKYYSQILCCTRPSNNRTQIAPEAIEKFFNQINLPELSQVNIMGGNIFEYSRWTSLKKILKTIPWKIAFYCHYSHLTDLKNRIWFQGIDHSVCRIIVTPPFSLDKKCRLQAALKKTKVLKQNTKFIFVVQGMKEIMQARAMISAAGITTFAFKPFANGNNSKFYHENVYTHDGNYLNTLSVNQKQFAGGKLNRMKCDDLVVLNNGYIFSGNGSTGERFRHQHYQI